MGRPAAGYRTKSGEKVPGVTTVIGNRVNAGGLMWWANRLAYEPLMQARAFLDALVNDRQPDMDAVRSFLAVNPDAFDHNKAAGSAADAGTLAHAMVESYLLGEAPEGLGDGVPDDVRSKAETAYLAFLEWAEQTRLEVEETELSLVSEAHKFGGTMDACVLSINGKLALADWKTSNGLYPDHLIQVAAYGVLWKEAFPERPVYGGYHIFRFSKDTGDFHHHFFQELFEAEAAFMHCLRLYEIDKALKKRAK